jgi:hypothetical protein
MELFQIRSSLLADDPRVGNPGLKLANTFGVKSLSRLLRQSSLAVFMRKRRENKTPLPNNLCDF